MRICRGVGTIIIKRRIGRKIKWSMELALMFKSTIAVLSVAGELIVEPFEINHDIERVKL